MNTLEGLDWCDGGGEQERKERRREQGRNGEGEIPVQPLPGDHERARETEDAEEGEVTLIERLAVYSKDLRNSPMSSSSPSFCLLLSIQWLARRVWIVFGQYTDPRSLTHLKHWKWNSPSARSSSPPSPTPSHRHQKALWMGSQHQPAASLHCSTPLFALPFPRFAHNVSA